MHGYYLDDVFKTIEDVAYDEFFEKFPITEELRGLYEQFINGRHYHYPTINSAMNGNISYLHGEDEEEAEERTERFKNLPRETIWGIVNQLCFLYGIAYATRSRRYERN